ncbi:MarR family winged helix-turn-helix transcriptional regulator [Actibacterium pelagium]|uniref:MarR family transcriptional regulator n=1 Tax=Actibacterium pelagium TaxID=2029103 RepID=A0A917AB34_9RHOB|nr:MarR family transcriptional regulator [Actibacterium pelagium]GGE38225.1 MarR family transcriptional regulator [Actibacterium pelagium]
MTAQTGPQEPPLSKERLRLWLRLLKASSLIEDELRRRLRAECNWTLPRFDVMSALSRSDEGLKMSEISKKLRVSNGNVTVVVDKLVEEGLALRVAVPDDRRANLIRLTPEGQTVFAEHAAVHEAWVDELLSGLNADDIEGMIRRLDHLTTSLEE